MAQRAGRRGPPRLAAVVEQQGAAVLGEDARGNQRRITERVEMVLQVRAPAEAREVMRRQVELLIAASGRVRAWIAASPREGAGERRLRSRRRW
jgi:hypothetical protein